MASGINLLIKKQSKKNNIGTSIIAENNLSLQSTSGDIKLSGTSIEAGNNLSIKAKKDLKLDGVIDNNSIRDEGHDYAHTIKDIAWNNKTDTQTLNKTTLQAGGDMGLTAEGKMSANGAKASAGGNLLINANEVNIDIQKTKNRSR